MAKRKDPRILKMKRRGRFARFSGATARSASRLELGIYTEDGKEVHVPVGPISLSRQTVSTGRGPDKTRMQEYYSRVAAKSFLEEIPSRSPEQIKAWIKQYRKNLVDAPLGSMLKINLATTTEGRLDLFCRGKEWFFIEVDFQKYIRMSRVYSSKDKALERMQSHRIAWEFALEPTT